MQDMQLTKHFKLSEATRSDTAVRLGIPNDPSAEDLATIHRTAIKMEEVRKILGKPVIVSSWYRNDKVNKAVGGVPTSQHRKGEAVDFKASGLTVAETIQILLDRSAEIEYDQLIKEPNWVHISFLTSHGSRNKQPRLQYLDLSK